MRTGLVKKGLLLASAVKKRRANVTDQGQVANDQRCDGLAGNETRVHEMRRTLPLFSRCTAWAQGRPPYFDASWMKNAVNGSAAVDKPLHIHRTGCAERRLLKTTHFFSTIGASPIQSLSSSFGRT